MSTVEAYPITKCLSTGPPDGWVSKQEADNRVPDGNIALVKQDSATPWVCATIDRETVAQIGQNVLWKIQDSGQDNCEDCIEEWH